MNDNLNATEKPEGTTQSPTETPDTQTLDMSAAMPEREVQAGKTFAILSYALSFIGLPFFLIPLITRDNAFTLYHAKQCLMIWLAGLALSIVSAPLAVICVGVILAIVGGVALLVFNIMGLINATKGEAKPVPLIGPWAVDWFKGIGKVAKN